MSIYIRVVLLLFFVILFRKVNLNKNLNISLIYHFSLKKDILTKLHTKKYVKHKFNII